MRQTIQAKIRIYRLQILLINDIMCIEVAQMYSNEFEKAFSDFLDGREYDQAESALFAIVRIAFIAGWKAAEGSLTKPRKISQGVHKEDIGANA
ncbi:MAG: hypothetical protein AAGU74_12970 [Bacillota bacterium]